VSLLSVAERLVGDARKTPSQTFVDNITVVVAEIERTGNHG
jgi:hypothetical protein